MKEKILKELNSRKLGTEQAIEWYKNNKENIPTSYYGLLSTKGMLDEIKDIIFYVEGL